MAGALRQTSAGTGLVQAVSAAPDLDAWGLVERLLADLAPLQDRLWLVIDDVHELGSLEALRQLELLVMRAPPQLRFVLAARHDMRLGLHRLRLEGELAEIRAGDLKFTLAEAGQLLAAAGVELPDQALRLLWERTEGWTAGLRLAALALAGHPDPVRFASEFSGTERTVAEYLHPAPGLVECHARHPTAHGSLLAEIRSLLSGTRPSPPAWPRPLLEAPNGSELRVLRYLPTNLTAPEIARELYVSPNTVKTHIRNLYAKLGTHRRAEAVERARALGLLAPTGTDRASRHDRTAVSLT